MKHKYNKPKITWRCSWIEEIRGLPHNGWHKIVSMMLSHAPELKGHLGGHITPRTHARNRWQDNKAIELGLNNYGVLLGAAHQFSGEDCYDEESRP